MKKTFEIIVLIIVISTLLCIILRVSKIIEAVDPMIINGFYVIVVSLTFFEMIRTNNINDKRLLRIEKKEIREDIENLKYSLCNKTVKIENNDILINKIIIDSENYKKIYPFLLKWTEDFLIIIEIINECTMSISDKKKFISDIDTLYNLFENDYYNNIPPDILLDSELEKQKENMKAKIKEKKWNN